MNTSSAADIEKVVNDAQPSAALAGSPAEELKKAISEVLRNALSGQAPALRTEDGYIRWGLVERIMHQNIDEIVGRISR